MAGLQPAVFELPSRPRKSGAGRTGRCLADESERGERDKMSSRRKEPPFCSLMGDYRFASEEAAAATAGQVAPQPPPQGGAWAAEAAPDPQAGVGALLFPA